MRLGEWAVAGLLAMTMMGCARTTTKVGKSDDVPDDQWSRGVWLYGQSCSGCHGDDGEGAEDTPKLAGDGAMPLEPPEGSDRTAKLGHAGDLFAYIKAEMPPLEPGSLTESQYWAITFYILKQAQIDVSPERLGAEELGSGNAAKVTLR
jgi:mono/diheme cytochrome c family protein